MIKILDKMEQEIDLFGGALKCLDIDPESPSFEISKDNTECGIGEIVLGQRINSRKIDVSFFFEAYDFYDFDLLRSRVYALFTDPPYYLIDERQPGKRWKVYCPDVYSIKRVNPNASDEFTISFYSPSPLQESVGTTLDSLSFDVEKWQLSQGLVTDQDFNYVMSTNSFQIYNPSDIIIDPRYFPLNIKYQGASNNLQIQNKTTGDIWLYTGTTTISDTIELDGIRSLKNSLSIFRYTNRNLITLAKGINDFELSGTSGSFQISFDFRFYYF
ncbi:phage tail family protein [Heyndrickxia ginsengihumi]|uniref:phage tail family protein n=1 Tax=Heyndrickxia ginsengihumi TaxID=363870 RepID=UPI0004718354|nr:phage tail family protein [Heyndrickxia ginsengihumi]